MMMFFTLLEKLWGGAKKVGIPLAAVGLSLFLSIAGTYALALVWGGMLVLRMLLGKFSRMDLRYTVILAVVWVGWGVYDAYHGPFEKMGVLRFLPEIAVALAMIAVTFVSEQYVGGEFAAWMRAKWLLWTTGKAHRVSNSDVKGSGRLREAGDMVPGKLGEFVIEPPAKPHVVLGSLVSERDFEKATKELIPTAKFLRWAPEGHMAEFAGSRGGKSSGSLAVALVDSWTGSMFVRDIKPELRDWSWRVREQLMGHKCVWLDTNPNNGMTPATWGYDLFEDIDCGPGLIGDCAAKAVVLLPPPKAKEGENWFLPAAQAVVTGDMAASFVEHMLGNRTRPKVSDFANTLLCTSKEALQERFGAVVARMKEIAEHQGMPDTYRVLAGDIVKHLAEYVKPSEDAGPQGTGELWEKVYGTISKEMAWLKDSRLARILSAETGATFSMYDIFSGKLTIYDNARLADAQSRPQFSAVIVASFIDLIVKEGDRMKRAGNCLFALDEALRYGNVPAIYKTGLELAAGAGVILWLFLQSIQGLKDVAGDGSFSSLMDNAIVVSFYSLGDKDTAEYVSSMLGSKTVLLANASISQQGAQSRGDHESIQFDGRKVLDVDEVLSLPKHLKICRVKGEHPILLSKPSYFLIPWLDKLIDKRKPKPPVKANADHKAAYRQSQAETVELLFGPADIDLDAAEEAAEAVLAGVAALRPDLFPDVPDMVRETHMGGG